MTEPNDSARLHFQLGALISALDTLTHSDRDRVAAELKRKASRATTPEQRAWIENVANAITMAAP